MRYFARKASSIVDQREKASLGSSTISVPAFAVAFERFKTAVATDKRSDGPFKSFASGLPYLWEFYKEWVYHEARHRLAPHTWKKREIGSGKILDRVISAIQIHQDQTLRNNMVQWDARWGEHGQSHQRLLAARTNRAARESLEEVFYSFYREGDRGQSTNLDRFMR